MVISGHDAIQTEQLFLKHVGPNDAFVQADVAGARTCFVRNPSGRATTRLWAASKMWLSQIEDPSRNHEANLKVFELVE